MMIFHDYHDGPLLILYRRRLVPFDISFIKPASPCRCRSKGSVTSLSTHVHTPRIPLVGFQQISKLGPPGHEHIRVVTDSKFLGAKVFVEKRRDDDISVTGDARFVRAGSMPRIIADLFMATAAFLTTPATALSVFDAAPKTPPMQKIPPLIRALL